MGPEFTGSDPAPGWQDPPRPRTMQPMATLASDRAWLTATNAPELGRREIHVWRMCIAPDQFAAWQSRTATLSQEEQARAGRFRFEHDRIAFQSAHIQLREVLSRYAGMAPAALIFEHSATGKPALQGAGVQFNLSHSGDWALCAVCATQAVGVDIERIRPMPDRDDVAAQVFTPRERAMLRGSDDERDCAFFALWTAKEAYIKGIGAGLGMDLQRFSVSESGTDAGTGIGVIIDSAAPTPAWQVHRLHPASGYTGALATPLDAAGVRLFALAA